MLSREEVKSKLFEIADGLGLVDESEEKKITVEEMDSIQLISIIVEIEECFDIEVKKAEQRKEQNLRKSICRRNN